MKKTSLLILSILIIFISCKTTPKNINEDLTPAEFFQLAQEAVVERNDFKTALLYYQTFIERYPDDPANVTAAEYEIAFIEYKRGNFDKAEILFSNLIAKYEGEDAALLPDWPRILSEKLLDEIAGSEEPVSTEEES